MKRIVFALTVFAAAVIAIAAVSSDVEQRKGGGAQDRDQSHMELHDKDRLHDRDRIQQQDGATLKDEEIYGHELMSREELNRYRNQLQQQHTAEDRERFQHEHEERMRERAATQGKDLVPPGQGPVYGGKLMSVEERNEYRERLRQIESEEERLRFEAQHREEMQKRAEALQIEIEDAG